MKTIKAKQSSSPLAFFSAFITLVIFFGLLFVYLDELKPHIARRNVWLLFVYEGSDWASLFFSWLFQRNLMARRDALMKFTVGGVSNEKKQDDLFDVRYLPEEYLSDVQADSDSEDEQPDPPAKKDQ